MRVYLITGFLIFLLSALFPIVCFAQDLKLSIDVRPKSVILGLPFQLTVRLSGADKFTLHGQFGPCDGHTLSIVKDDSGNILNLPVGAGCLSAEKIALDSYAKSEYLESAEFSLESYWPAGKYFVTVQYISKGPYLDRFSDTDIRPVEGIWIGELTSNEVEITVKNPEGIDQEAFSALRPSQEKLLAPENEISSFLIINGEQILQDYAKSNYAAWILWKKGESNYSSFTYDDKLSVEEEFNFPAKLQEVGMTVYEYLPETVQGIIEPWETLIKDFPAFYKRAEILKGLAKVYIRMDERQKAIPLIKELLEKYPESDEAKKVAIYKDWMQQKNIWK